MKKTILAIAIVSLVGLGTTNISYANSNTPSGASAEASFMSGLVILSATVAPLMFFEELSRTSQPLKVKEVKHEGNKSKVNLQSGAEKVELQVDRKVADKLAVQPGMDVNVKKNSMGYTLDIDNKVLGVVSNSGDFKTNKLN